MGFHTNNSGYIDLPGGRKLKTQACSCGCGGDPMMEEQRRIAKSRMPGAQPRDNSAGAPMMLRGVLVANEGEPEEKAKPRGAGPLRPRGVLSTNDAAQEPSTVACPSCGHDFVLAEEDMVW